MARSQETETRIISVDDVSCLESSVRALREGGIVIYPTETSYGMGVDFENEAAKKKIYSVKGREEEKKLSVIVPDMEVIKNYVLVSRETEMLAEKFMPGPLTLVVKMKNSDDTLAFRIPSNDFALKLCREMKKPVTATSVNFSGESPLYEIKEVIDNFTGKVDVIVDAGDLEKNEPSSVYDVENHELLREGKIKLKDLNS